MSMVSDEQRTGMFNRHKTEKGKQYTHILAQIGIISSEA